MVHYNNAVDIYIENVEHPIHILGVQPQAMIICFWAFLITLSFSPLLAPFGAIAVAITSRFLFLEELSGRPFSFSHQALALIKKYPFFRSLFPSSNGLVLFNGVYYGS